MADWIENELCILGDTPRLLEFQRQADERGQAASGRDPYNGASSPSVLSFHRLRPVPAEVVARGYDVPDGGCGWQIANWGVQWGARDAVLHEASLLEFGRCLLYTFETASASPKRFIKAASVLYPELTFVLKFNLPGEDWEEVVYEGGTLVDEPGED